MGVSQGSITTGPAGLTLKASGLITGTATLLTGLNIASVARKAGESAGVYVVTFSAALASGNFLVVWRANTGNTSTPPYQIISEKTTAGFTVTCYQYSGKNDPDFLHFEVYAV